MGIAAVKDAGVAIPFVQRALGPRERLLKLLAAEAVEIGVVFQIGPAPRGSHDCNFVYPWIYYLAKMASEVRLAEIRRDLEHCGWRLVRISGSHHIFEKTGESPLYIPVHRNKVKPCYVGKVKKACGKR